jgi:hypothetical protein
MYFHLSKFKWVFNTICHWSVAFINDSMVSEIADKKQLVNERVSVA